MKPVMTVVKSPRLDAENGLVRKQLSLNELLEMLNNGKSKHIHVDGEHPLKTFARLDK